MTTGSLMKVKSIAECSKGQKYCRILPFWPALSDNWSWKPLVFLEWLFYGGFTVILDKWTTKELVCAFVVHMQQKQVFSRQGPHRLNMTKTKKSQVYPVRPRTVWISATSLSSQCAQRVVRDPNVLHAVSKDSNQPTLVFSGGICLFHWFCLAVAQSCRITIWASPLKRHLSHIC